MAHAVPAIPDSLRENLAYGLGEAEAERWLGEAVGRAELLFDAWQLSPQVVLSGGSESLCVKCLDAHGDETVLKLPVHEATGVAEVAALRAWAGDGAARVLRAEAEHNALLMNFLGWVGEGSYHLRDVLDLADRLHTCPVDTDAFPSLEANLARRVAWAAARFAESGDGPAARDVVEAEELLAKLLAGSDERVLLHGDFQPKNVIVGERGLGAVDPQPAIGPDIFDIALWVVKCGHEHGLVECIGDVYDLRSEIDVELLRQWCWALSVLESRPYLGAVNNHRTDFIDLVRDLV